MLPLLLAMDAFGLKALCRARDQALAGLSGFTSIVAHAGGPSIGFFMLPLRLAPLQFTATMAVFFAVINALGVWLGLRIGRGISPSRFYTLVELGLLLTGCKLLWDGVKPLLG